MTNNDKISNQPPKNINGVRSINKKLIFLSIIILLLIGSLTFGYFKLENTADRNGLLAIISPIMAALIQTWLKLMFETTPNERKAEVQETKNYGLQIKSFLYTIGEAIREFTKCFIIIFKFKSKPYSFIKFSFLLITIIFLSVPEYISKLSTGISHIVTKAEYSDFLQKTDILPPLRIDDLNASDPIINVNWHNAKKYCDWHNGRLYAEKEWRKNVSKNQISYNYREWTNTDTLSNCAVVCDYRYVDSDKRCQSWESKDKYSDQIIFRCVHSALISSQLGTILKFCSFSGAFIFLVLFLLPFKKYCI